MTLPSKVDLRSEYEQVYNQGSDNSCGPHAITAILDCMYERATGIQHRFDKEYIWNWAKYYRGVPSYVNNGIDFTSAESTLRINGAKLIEKDNKPVSEIITGFKLVRSSVSGTDGLKEKLALGVPILYTINVPSSFGVGNDWRKHTVTFNTEFTGGLHYVALIGYDDDAQRYLFENSWGANWGDGGFFGVPYDQAISPFFVRGIEQINEAPVPNISYEGFKMPAYMLTRDQVAFADRATNYIRSELNNALQQDGVQALINKMIEMGVSDKHLETLYMWDRGSVRQFKQENPNLNWDGFIWDQL